MARRGEKQTEEWKAKMREAWKHRAPITEETRKKLSESHKGKKISPEAIAKRVAKIKGTKRTPEQIERMRLAHQNISEETREKLRIGSLGHVVTEEMRAKLSKAGKGRAPPNKGKHLSEETKRKLSEVNKGKSLSEETKKKIGAAIKGEKHPNWLGGKSFEPYCVLFNNEFKERVRNFFGRKCVECGIDEIKEKHHVHHVNYRKDSCCNEDIKPLFVCLCRSCHMKTNKNREYWENHFTDIINERYGGRCYYTTEEFNLIKQEA